MLLLWSGRHHLKWSDPAGVLPSRLQVEMKTTELNLVLNQSLSGGSDACGTHAADPIQS